MPVTQAHRGKEARRQGEWGWSGSYIFGCTSRNPPCPQKNTHTHPHSGTHAHTGHSIPIHYAYTRQSCPTGTSRALHTHPHTYPYSHPHTHMHMHKHAHTFTHRGAPIDCPHVHKEACAHTGLACRPSRVHHARLSPCPSDDCPWQSVDPPCRTRPPPRHTCAQKRKTRTRRVTRVGVGLDVGVGVGVGGRGCGRRCGCGCGMSVAGSGEVGEYGVCAWAHCGG